MTDRSYAIRNNFRTLCLLGHYDIMTDRSYAIRNNVDLKLGITLGHLSSFSLVIHCFIAIIAQCYNLVLL